MTSDLRVKQLRTLSPKKWLLSFLGQKPTIDENFLAIGKGCHVGDFVLDVSQDPNFIWICIEQTAGNPDFKLIFPDKLVTSNIITNYTVDLDLDKVVPVDATLNDIIIYLSVGTKISGDSIHYLNVQYESVTIYSPYKYGCQVSIVRIDNSNHIVSIVPIGVDPDSDWLII